MSKKTQTTHTRATTRQSKATSTRAAPTEPARIAMGQVEDLADAKVKAIAQRVLAQYKIAFEKAMGHHAEPANYPISPDPNAAERVFLTQIQQRPVEQQQLAMSKIMPAVRATQAQRNAAYGDLGKVNLKSATAVRQQVSTLRFPASLKFPAGYFQPPVKLFGQILTPFDTVALRNGRGINQDDPPPGPNPHPVPDPDPLPAPNPPPNPTEPYADKLELRILKVRCANETNELGKDEIAMGGSSINAVGNTRLIGELKVGSFKKGATKTYSPAKVFDTFILTLGGNDYPKSCFGLLSLAEKDHGGFKKFLDFVWTKVKEDVEKAVLAAAASIGTIVGGLLGAIIAATAAYVVMALVEWMIGMFGDDIFTPVTVSVQIPSKNPRFSTGLVSPQDVAVFKAHGGRYEVTYDWRVFA